MTRRSIIFLASMAALPFAALALAACGGGDNSTSPAPPKTMSGAPATIGVASGDLGTILVDSQGRTLYLFKKDSGTTSSCTGECANDWPPLRASKPTEGSGVSTSLVGTTKRSDGEAQVTYNGHPLYLFEGDKKPGDTNGEGLNAFGAAWYALSASGNQVSGPPANSGGGGYGY
jgi:predicted lipoprotein with Yx(FWY)xxD motif